MPWFKPDELTMFMFMHTLARHYRKSGWRIYQQSHADDSGF